MPEGRSHHYAIWRACERYNVKPPNVKQLWDENTPHTQSMLIAFSQIRDYEEVERMAMMNGLTKV